MDPNRKLKALIIEDDSEMADLVKNLLRKRFSISSEIAQDCASARQMLMGTDYDVITLDYRLPDGAGLDLLDEITGSLEHPPVIMVTGHGDEETAARSFRSRASGYVVKDARLPDMLSEAVEKALAEIALKKVERELLDEKAFIEDALNCLPDLFAVLDVEGNFFRWNRKVSEVTGYSDEEISSMNIAELLRPEDEEVIARSMEKMKGGQRATDDLVLVTKSGANLDYELSGHVMRNNKGIPIGFCGTGRSISERKRVEEDLRIQRAKLESLVKTSTAELAEVNEQLRKDAVELEQARKALRDSEEQFSTILENSPDIIATFDRNGVFLNSNRASELIMGYEPREFMGRSVFDMVHPEDLPALLEAHNQVVGRGATSRAVECRFLHKDGTWHILELVGQGFTDSDGELTVVVNARDITDRKTAEEASEKFRATAEGANYGVAIMDTEFHLIYLNPYLAAAHDYRPEELEGKSVTVFHGGEEQLKRARELIAELRIKGSFHAKEVWHTRRDGSVFPMLVSAAVVKDKDGNDLFMTATAIDISDHKRAEEQLRMITDHMADIITYVDTQGIYKYVSPSFGALLGYDPEETLGHYVLDLLDYVHPDDVDTFVRAATDGLNATHGDRIQYRYKHADGHYLWLESVGAPLRDKTGRSAGTVITSRDITERRRIEEELRRLNTELEGYARTVSHDLKSPLTSIKLAGENLLRIWEKRAEIDDLDSEIGRIAEVIEIGAGQAEDLIGDLLELAVAGQEPEEISEVDITSMVNRIIAERDEEIQDKRLRVRLDGYLGTVKANPTHMYQLFSNFIDNAIKHNSDSNPTLDIQYSGKGPSGHVYTVKDNGPGIKPGDEANIFLPFFKGENGYTGIGLAIVEKIIKVYNGSVKVSGNAGACFEFSIRDRD